jgi:dihydroflavonol-4-reductase
LADQHGRIGERYVLGGRDMLLREILEEIARIAGTRPPKVRLPHNAILPVAYAAEWWARLTGAEPFVTVDGINLAKKRMFFSSAKAAAELGYQARPAEEALADAVAWFRHEGYL